ncbi:MAG: hypothetical protein CMH58_10150 [Myxococcales bacterium]|nr:hypothetical protein [Myxococcales bacterium]|tara:strand:+ start:1442 stop:1786 length:345 start_codon:yes stop_codon:yes gene_type:complete
MHRIFVLIVLVGIIGCAQNRCQVERQMNCDGDAVEIVDNNYEQCGECQKKLTDDEKALEDCWWNCMAEAGNYQCSEMSNDRCAMECTGEDTALKASSKLLEVELERLRHEICRY